MLLIFWSGWDYGVADRPASVAISDTKCRNARLLAVARTLMHGGESSGVLYLYSVYRFK